eukprot:TRINITY_DN6098_c0_g2_i7.p1 TRINITY_DN6098_c0_g2~~TRINITY_DN6098_c0_g2_i7.p1  ORF type:complete len:138 (-),score=19.90 TRINITY_DN6098_c0_g2_i7:175-588(-)
MLGLFVLKQRIEDAFKVINLLRQTGKKPTLQMYNLILDWAGNYANLEVTTGCFNQMRKVGVQPDITSWNCVIKCLCRLSKVDETETCLQKMMTSDPPIEPDSKTFHYLISCCVRKKDLTKAQTLFDSLTKVINQDIT